MAAIAATTIEPRAPARWVVELRVIRESCLILPFVCASNANQRFENSG